MGKVVGCGFCPETANITGEHLWSAWFGKKLRTKKLLVTRKEADGTLRQWPKKSLDEKARVVCGLCNNGWMSDLECQAKTIVDDMALYCTPKALHARDLTILAASAFKGAIVADLMHDNRPPFFSLFQRRRFAKDLTIPSGVQMWLGSIAHQRGLFKSYYAVTKAGTSQGFELNIFTYALGHLVIQVVSAKWKKKAHRRHASPPALTQAVEWDAVSVPFWPNCGATVSWPPPMHMGDAVVDEFVRRWGNIKRAA
jgi:hypothetical protein